MIRIFLIFCAIWALSRDAQVMAQVEGADLPEETADGSGPEPPDNEAAGSTPSTPPTRAVLSPAQPGTPPKDASPQVHTSTSTEPMDESATENKDEPSLIEEDVVPTISVYKGDNVEMRMGGLIQVHFAPYVGNESLVANEDTATSEGFRLRRARLGIEGAFGHDTSLLLVVNPLESDPDVGTLSSARLSYRFLPGMQVNVGTDSVPFTRAELESSRSLATIERPLVTRTIVPGRRLGVTLEGALANRLGFVAAVMNGTEGYELGNRFGGFLYAARVQLDVFGHPSGRHPENAGLAISLGGLYDDGPATRGLGASADVFVTMARASAKIELACDRQAPQDAPMPSPGLADTIERCGGYAELGYLFPEAGIQPVLRFEYFDDNRDIEDAGDALLFSVGINARLRAYTRVQLHYLSRRERFANDRANDAVVMNLQGDF